MSHLAQQWEPVVLRSKTAKEDPKSKESIKRAQRSGGQVDTLSKDHAREERDRMRKLETDLDPNADAPSLAQLQCLNIAMRKAMVEARTKKGLNQTQLANMINVRTQIVQDLETGKVVNEKGILQKLRTALGVSLRFGK